MTVIRARVRSMQQPWIRGKVARQAHVAIPAGTVEEEYGRSGFFGGYAHAYRLHAPVGWVAIEGPLRPRAFDLRRPLPPGQDDTQRALGRTLFAENEDVRLHAVRLAATPTFWLRNGDADELFFVAEGEGWLESMFGVLDFRLHDYVVVPRGVPYRFGFRSPPRLFCVEAFRGFGVPKEFINHRGQLRLDAPYNERDFRGPDRLLDVPAGKPSPRIVVCRNRYVTMHTYTEWPYDVVGWDGYVWPFALNLHDYRPKTSTYHLPPTSHCVFEAKGFVVMNFVPRIVDYGADAIPCPYPHSSIDCDEVLYYADGDFTSRKGIEKHSVSFHPAGIPHGPHPEKYERSLGMTRTEEVAIMVDTFAPLAVTRHGEALSDRGYHFSWNTRDHL